MSTFEEITAALSVLSSHADLSYDCCMFTTSAAMTCPLCGVAVAANVTHTCSRPATPAPKQLRRKVKP